MTSPTLLGTFSSQIQILPLNHLDARALGVARGIGDLEIEHRHGGAEAAEDHAIEYFGLDTPPRAWRSP
jgi:hypothetical protein